MPAPKLGVRQLSLQGTSSPTPATTHRGPIRRQMSDNDFLHLRIGPEKSAEKRTNAATRPKVATRLAWAEQLSPDKEIIGGGVEVVARRCAGLPRPSATRPPQKDPAKVIAPTREQLAERLRRAWRGRNHRKNLDIYLAHSRPESAQSTRTVTSDDNEIHIIATKAVRAIHNRPMVSKTTASEQSNKTTLQERNKIEINLGVEDGEESSSVKDLFHVRSMSFTKQDSFNKENMDDRPKLSASERRASFKTSQLLNRTITGSFSDDADPEIQNDFQVFLTRPPLIRTSSAPTERTAQQNFNTKINKPVVEKKFEFCGQEENQEKSSARRKIKTGATRRKPKERNDSSGDEEIENQNKKAPRRRQIPRPGSDIITMVSLVSPAESDADEPQLMTTGLITNAEKTVPETLPEPVPEPTTSFILQNLRKTVKTAHPPVSRSCSASFPMRRVPPGAPIIIPTPISVPTPAPAVQDSRGIKRRLIRAKTTPISGDEEETASSEDATSQPDPVILNNETHIDDDPESLSMELMMKSPKEKECWALYKKMVDKGVTVCYDTILRGMLTPTEYRLRQNQISRR